MPRLELKYSPDEDAIVKAGHERGLSMAVISRQLVRAGFERSPSAVRDRIRRLCGLQETDIFAEEKRLRRQDRRSTDALGELLKQGLR